MVKELPKESNRLTKLLALASLTNVINHDKTGGVTDIKPSPIRVKIPPHYQARNFHKLLKLNDPKNDKIWHQGRKKI